MTGVSSPDHKTFAEGTFTESPGAGAALRLLFWLRMVAIGSQAPIVAFVHFVLDEPAAAARARRSRSARSRSGTP